MSALDDLRHFALTKIEELAKGALPKLAAPVLAAVEKIANSVNRAAGGKLSVADARAAIDRLTKTLHDNDAMADAYAEKTKKN